MADQQKAGKPQIKQGLYKKNVQLKGQERQEQEDDELDPTELKLQIEVFRV